MIYKSTTQNLLSLTLFVILITLKSVNSQTYTLSGYTLTDLTGTSIGTFPTQAGSWSASTSISGTLYTTGCGVFLLGGPSVLGNSLTAWKDFFSITYSSLPSHNIIYYTMNFYAFDSWDANTYDRFQLSFDSRKVNGWMLPTSLHTTNLCGTTSLDLGPIQILGRISHSASSLTLKVTSLLDQATNDESFGFRDITMLFATTRTSVTEDICGRHSASLPQNKCPCASGEFESGYIGKGTCQACHTNCMECFGASERECYTCKPGFTWNGYACLSSCHSTCSGSIYNCFGAAINNCLVCLPGYFLTDINSCLTSAQCSFPLIQSVSGSVNVCLSPCTWDQYAYKNGSCLSTCPYPLQFSKTANFSLCNSPCSGSQYLYFNQSCRSYCNYPWRTRIEGGIQFCDFPCESPEILYWDQNCRTSCPPPLQLYYESTFKFCLYKCTSGQYLFQNESCLATCPSPLNSSTLGGANFCNNLCDNSEFLYWNKSCLSECKSPFRYRGDNIADYCLPPCEDTSQYYYPDTGVCKSTCADGIAWSDDLGMYKTCKLISEAAIDYMDATNIGRVSILSLVRPLEYIRYMDIAVPERLGELMYGQQRNVFSLRFGYKMSASMQAQFTKYEIPAVFERMGLHSSFLINYWTEITSFAILLIIATISLFFEKLFRLLEWTTLQSLFERIRAVLKWNVFLIIIATGITDIIIFSMLEFSTFHFLTFTSIISMIACLFMISMLVAFVINILHLVSGLQEIKSQALVSRPHDDYADFLIRWQGYQLVFRGFKDNLIHQQYFYIIYCFRVASPMLIACFVYQIPFMQTILYTLINISIIIYIVLKRPLKSKTNWIQLLFIEGITLVINFSLFILSALDLGSASTGTAGIFFGDVIIVGNCCLTLTLIVFLIIKVVNLAKAAEILHKKQPELAKATLAQVFFVPIQQCGFGFEYVQVARYLYEIKPPTEGQLGNTFDNNLTDNDTAVKRFKFSKNQTPNPTNKDRKKNWIFELFAATRSRTKDKDGENYFDEIEDELEIFGKIKNP